MQELGGEDALWLRVFDGYELPVRLAHDELHPSGLNLMPKLSVSSAFLRARIVTRRIDLKESALVAEYAVLEIWPVFGSLSFSVIVYNLL